MKQQRKLFLARAALTLLLALLTTVGAWADNNFTDNGDGTYTGFIGGSASGVSTTIEDCAFTG